MGYRIELIEQQNGSVAWIMTDIESFQQRHGCSDDGVAAFSAAFAEVCVTRIDRAHPLPASGAGILTRKERSGPRARFNNLARRIQSAWERGFYDGERYLLLATRLWNHADHQRDSETFFDILTGSCPDAFSNPSDANSIIFTYPKETA